MRKGPPHIIHVLRQFELLFGCPSRAYALWNRLGLKPTISIPKRASARSDHKNALKRVSRWQPCGFSPRSRVQQQKCDASGSVSAVATWYTLPARSWANRSRG